MCSPLGEALCLQMGSERAQKPCGGPGRCHRGQGVPPIYGVVEENTLLGGNRTVLFKSGSKRLDRDSASIEIDDFFP